MNIANFVDRVFVIDNKDDESAPLKQLFESMDIDVSVFNPANGNDPKPLLKTRQLIFVDLMLDEDVTHANSNLSQLVGLLSKIVTSSFGLYGLIVWTKHEDYIQKLKEYINNAVYQQKIEVKDEEDVLAESLHKLEVAPMFIVALNKLVYIEAGNYNNLIADIETSLAKSNASSFLINWSTSVKTAFEKSIKEIYSIHKDYEKQESIISYLLYSLACNYTGVKGKIINSLTVDCYKAFDELLYAELFVQQKNIELPKFSESIQSPWETDEQKKLVQATINAKMFLDFDAVSQDIIVPGNVYKLKGDSINKYKMEEKPNWEGKPNIDPYDITDVAIELTPPCDFSNKKIASRIVRGYIVKPHSGIDKRSLKGLRGSIKACEKRYSLSDILIDGSVQSVVFDYRHLYSPSDSDLLDKEKFQIWFRVKPKLFADILQKFSSHAARIGLAELTFE